MEFINRLLGLKLPPGQSAFLWGARKTGKSTLLREHFPESVSFDFLKTDLFIEFSKQPSLLRQRLDAMTPARLAHPIILDEVQKIPAILDEVHWLIENRKYSMKGLPGTYPRFRAFSIRWHTATGN